MTIVIADIYVALREAGVSEADAGAAAEVPQPLTPGFTPTERETTEPCGACSPKVELGPDLRVLQWEVRIAMSLVAILVFQAFFRPH